MASRGRKKEDITPRAVAVLNPPLVGGASNSGGHPVFPRATAATTPRGAWAHLQKSFEDIRDGRFDEIVYPMYRACDNALYQVESGFIKLVKGTKANVARVSTEASQIANSVSHFQQQCVQGIQSQLEVLESERKKAIDPVVHEHVDAISQRGQAVVRHVSGIFERVDGERSSCPRCKGSGLLVQRKNWDTEEVHYSEEPCWFCEGVGVMPILDLNGYMVARAPSLIRTRDPPLKPRKNIRVQLYLGKFPGTRTRITAHRVPKEVWWHLLYTPSAIPLWLAEAVPDGGTSTSAGSSSVPWARDRASPHVAAHQSSSSSGAGVRPSRPGSAMAPPLAGEGRSNGRGEPPICEWSNPPSPPPGTWDGNGRYRSPARSSAAYHSGNGSIPNRSALPPPRSDSPLRSRTPQGGPGPGPVPGPRYSGPVPDQRSSAYQPGTDGAPPQPSYRTTSPQPGPHRRQPSSANGHTPGPPHPSSRTVSPSRAHPQSQNPSSSNGRPPAGHGYPPRPYASSPPSRSISPTQVRPPSSSSAASASASSASPAPPGTSHGSYPSPNTRYSDSHAGSAGPRDPRESSPPLMRRGQLQTDASGIPIRARSPTPATSRSGRERGSGAGGGGGNRSPRRGERSRVREKAEREANERARRLQRSVSPRTAVDGPDVSLGPTTYPGGEGQASSFSSQSAKWGEAMSGGWVSPRETMETKDLPSQSRNGSHGASPSHHWLTGAKVGGGRRGNSLSDPSWVDELDVRGKTPTRR